MVHFILQVEHWLTYWLIFGAFVVLETFEEYPLLHLQSMAPISLTHVRDRTLVYYLPLYHYVKLAVLLWAFLPQTLVWP